MCRGIRFRVPSRGPSLYLGMFPLILTVLNRAFFYVTISVSLRTVSIGGKSQHTVAVVIQGLGPCRA